MKINKKSIIMYSKKLLIISFIIKKIKEIKKIISLKKANDPYIVYYYNLKKVKNLSIIDDEINDDTLPSFLIMEPNKYYFAGKKYDCSKPGLYRFINPQHQSFQRIVFAKDNPILNALFLSFLSIRGNGDDSKGLKSLEKKAKINFISVTCSQNASFCNEILKRNSINSRKVFSQTIDVANSYNNGHVLIEVFSNKHNKYVVIDLDKKIMFKIGSNPLSLYEYSHALFYKKKVEIKQFSPIPMVDWMGFKEKATNFNYGFIEFEINSSQKQIEKCLSRICQIPLMEKEGKMHACAWNIKLEKKLKDLNPNWEIYNPFEFEKNFYKN